MSAEKSDFQNVYQTIYELNEGKQVALPGNSDVYHTMDDAFGTIVERVRTDVEKPLHPWINLYPVTLVNIERAMIEVQETANAYYSLDMLRTGFNNVVKEQEEIQDKLRDLQKPGTILSSEEKEMESHLITRYSQLRAALEDIYHSLHSEDSTTSKDKPSIVESLYEKQTALLGQFGQSLYLLDEILDSTILFHHSMQQKTSHLASVQTIYEELDKEQNTPENELRIKENSITVLDAMQGYITRPEEVRLDEYDIQPQMDEDTLYALEARLLSETEQEAHEIFPQAPKLRELYIILSSHREIPITELLTQLYPELIENGQFDQARTNFNYLRQAFNKVRKERGESQLESIRNPENRREVHAYMLPPGEEIVNEPEEQDEPIPIEISSDSGQRERLEVIIPELRVQGRSYTPVGKILEEDVFKDRDGFLYTLNPDGDMKPYLLQGIHLEEGALSESGRQLVSSNRVEAFKDKLKRIQQRRISASEIQSVNVLTFTPITDIEIPNLCLGSDGMIYRCLEGVEPEPYIVNGLHLDLNDFYTHEDELKKTYAANQKYTYEQERNGEESEQEENESYYELALAELDSTKTGVYEQIRLEALNTYAGVLTHDEIDMIMYEKLSSVDPETSWEVKRYKGRSGSQTKFNPKMRTHFFSGLDMYLSGKTAKEENQKKDK